MPVLVDAVFKGKPRKLLLQANRNGYLLHAGPHQRQIPARRRQFVSKMDWATGLTPDGKADSRSGAMIRRCKGTTTCPSTAGATNWPSPTYDPETGMFYFVAAEGCGINFRASSPATMPAPAIWKARTTGNDWQLYTRALDALTGKKMWDYKQVRSNHYGPGLMSTAGGILFAPEQFGQFTGWMPRPASRCGISIPAIDHRQPDHLYAWTASNMSPSPRAPISSPSACRTGAGAK